MHGLALFVIFWLFLCYGKYFGPMQKFPLGEILIHNLLPTDFLPQQLKE
jgi:hypothetical protein